MASMEPKILISYSEYQRLQTIATKYEKLVDDHHQKGKFIRLNSLFAMALLV